MTLTTLIQTAIMTAGSLVGLRLEPAPKTVKEPRTEPLTPQEIYEAMREKRRVYYWRPDTYDNGSIEIEIKCGLVEKIDDKGRASIYTRHHYAQAELDEVYGCIEDVFSSIEADLNNIEADADRKKAKAASNR